MDSLFKLLLCLRMIIFSLLSCVKRREVGLLCVCVRERERDICMDIQCTSGWV